MYKPFQFLQSVIQRGLNDIDLAAIARLYSMHVDSPSEFFRAINSLLGIDNFIQPKLIIASLEVLSELE